MTTSIDKKTIYAVDIVDSTTTGRSLLTGDAATGRSALELGTIATQNSNSAAITGGTASGLSSISVTAALNAGATGPNVRIGANVGGSAFPGIELLGLYGFSPSVYQKFGIAANSSGSLSFLATTGATGSGTTTAASLTASGVFNTNQVSVGVGSVFAPSVAVDSTSASETGLYRPSLGALGLVASRAEKIRINAAGRVLLGGTTDDGATAVQVNGNAYISGTLKIGSSSTPIVKNISAVATLDFPSIAAQSSADLTVTVTGAAVGDVVNVGRPASPTAGILTIGFVSAANTVTVRAFNITSGAIDPPSNSYRVAVLGF